MRTISPQELTPYAPTIMEQAICDIAEPIFAAHGSCWKEFLALTINAESWTLPDRVVLAIQELVNESYLTTIPLLSYHLGVDEDLLHYVNNREINRPKAA